MKIKNPFKKQKPENKPSNIKHSVIEQNPIIKDRNDLLSRAIRFFEKRILLMESEIDTWLSKIKSSESEKKHVRNRLKGIYQIINDKSVTTLDEKLISKIERKARSLKKKNQVLSKEDILDLIEDENDAEVVFQLLATVGLARVSDNDSDEEQSELSEYDSSISGISNNRQKEEEEEIVLQENIDKNLASRKKGASKKFKLEKQLANVISRFTIPTSEEEAEYTKALVEGTPVEREEAQNKLLMRNSRMPYSIARKYAKNTADLFNIFIAALFGSHKALGKYNKEYGCKALTYMYWWASQAGNRYLRLLCKLIREPVHREELLVNILSHVRDIRNREGREPLLTELCEIFKMSLNKLVNIIRLKTTSEPLSLEKKIGNGEGSSIRSIVPDEKETDDPEKSAEADERKRILSEIIEEIEDKLVKQVVEAATGLGKYRFPLSNEEISEKFNMKKIEVKKVLTEARKFLDKRVRDRLGVVN